MGTYGLTYSLYQPRRVRGRRMELVGRENRTEKGKGKGKGKVL